MLYKTSSAKKSSLIEKYLLEDIKVGESVMVDAKHIPGSYRKDGVKVPVVVCNVSDNYIEVRHDKDVPIKIDISLISKVTRHIGSDSFIEDDLKIRSLSCDIESILMYVGVIGDHKNYSTDSGIQIGECNFNPYIYTNKGLKERYQRGLVWDEDDCRKLIDSIYYGVDCGKLLIRHNSYEHLEETNKKYGETELYFNEIVDGLQRLTALNLFVHDKYQDSNGDYFGDLSDAAQHKFMGSLVFGFNIIEDATDEQVLRQFLKVNHTGRPQSAEHINHVKQLYTTVSK